MTALKEKLRSQAAAELQQLGAILRAGKADAGVAGRILRAHLVVETRLRRHIQTMNPNLGPIEDLKLSFHRLRVAAIGLKVGSVAWANEGLECLNAIRNKLAHRLDTKISLEDVKALRVDADALLGDSVAKDRLAEIAKDPAWIVEAWTMIFGTMLAVEQVMERHVNDIEARQRELDASAAQLLHELFDDAGEKSGV